ncbi:(Fe-S)-binding protein [Aestuariimicrobium kwangyangense]|uniref:(Fe-S)-binding protein n=1 Tax=Aestuariimicrobium kwangyangense TaxID=396389 RepID=UPI00047DADE4|nr:(Fe-S)-binding protein [Aestuariimicrobium kwangyangense]
MTSRPSVALFATCINDTMFPGTAIATVRLLERLGCTVTFPEAQTCCGQMLTNTGYIAQAEPVVRTFVRAFEGADYVVGPSGSCVGSARHQHPMIASKVGDEGLRRASETLNQRVFELSEFLVDVLGVTDVGAWFPHRVTFHPTCHSIRVAGVGDRPQRLLREVGGIDLVDLPDADQCCGFGGTFSVKNPDVSVSMGSDKARSAVSTGAEYLVAGDNSCLMHIGGLLSRSKSPVTPIHLAEILASTREDPR